MSVIGRLACAVLVVVAAALAFPLLTGVRPLKADPPGEFKPPPVTKPVKAILAFDRECKVNAFTGWKADAEKETQEWLDGKRKVLSLPPGVIVTFYDENGVMFCPADTPFHAGPPPLVLPLPAPR